VGRQADRHIRLDSLTVSHCHAEIFLEHEKVWVRDMGSTNGTFVNQERVHGATILGVGDIIRFGDTEFQVAEMKSQGQFIATRSLRPDEIETIWGQRGRLMELLDKNAIHGVYQPIFRLSSLEIIGYEGLARSSLEGFEAPPLELFHLAETLHLGAELSRLCRQRITEEARLLPQDQILFVNTHPEELEDHDALLASVQAVRQEVQDLELVLELHEEAMVDAAPLRSLTRALGEAGVGLAFDDFGSGKARLLELVEVRPAYLKVDMRLIRDLHEASTGRREMLRSMVDLCRNMGIKTVAEGIEDQGEAEACAELGFDLGQGFHLGLPDMLPSSW
jgi:EAL domain-containing protein (putative c-di-GMP-specific phosphodiesterase class I)